MLMRKLKDNVVNTISDEAPFSKQESMEAKMDSVLKLFETILSDIGDCFKRMDNFEKTLNDVKTTCEKQDALINKMSTTVD